MIDLDKLHDLPFLTFPTVIRDALRIYPLEGSWSDEGEFYVDLDMPDAFTDMLNAFSEDLPDFFDERLMEIIQEYTGGHQFHRFASGDILVNEQGLQVTKDEFIPADQYDIPRKEEVTWKVRPPADLLVPGARVQFNMIQYEPTDPTAVQSITRTGTMGRLLRHSNHGQRSSSGSLMCGVLNARRQCYPTSPTGWPPFRNCSDPGI
ncbi:MAG: hypothetical protein IPJ06_00265 [Saprospiraceae bacterium]|nr:hypothetical protein [Saprospiraceae bacterium]